jgi:hypothetical protein
MIELRDLWNVQLRGDNLVAFVNDWTAALQGMNPDKIPGEETLEMLFCTQIERSAQMQVMMSRYEENITLELNGRSYKQLRKLVIAHISSKRLKKNQLVARGGKASAYPGKGGKPDSDNRQAGECYKWRDTGACVKGNDCSFNHDGEPARKGGKKKKKGKGAKGDKGPRGRSPGKGGDDNKVVKRGKSPSGQLDKGPCFSFKAGNCTKGKDCNFWHPGQCREFKKGNCKQGDKCCFFHGDRPKAMPAAAKPEPKNLTAKEQKEKDAAREKSREAKKVKRKEKKAVKRALAAQADGG